MGQSFTRDGQLLGEAVSALQKSIRRCLVEDSVYWADEIMSRYHNYIVRRLMIIAIEDVGMADLMVVERALSTLNAVYTAFNEKKRTIEPADMRYLVINVVRQLAVAQKSREADEFQHHTIRAMRLDMVPVLTDKPTYEEAIQVLFDLIEQRDEVQSFAAAIELNNGYVDWLWRDLAVYASIHYDDGVVANLLIQLRNFVKASLDAGRGDYEPLVLGLAILLLTRSDRSSSHVEILNTQDQERLSNRYQKRPVPDYALDIHTGRGRAKGRSMKFFAEHGAKINNQGYESKYKMWDPELGSGSMLPDDRTRVPDDWMVSGHAQEGKPRKFRVRDGVAKEIDPDNDPALPKETQQTFELKF